MGRFAPNRWDTKALICFHRFADRMDSLLSRREIKISKKAKKPVFIIYRRLCPDEDRSASICSTQGGLWFRIFVDGGSRWGEGLRRRSDGSLQGTASTFWWIAPALRGQ